MSTPSYSSPCIAPDNTGQNAYLFGVPSSGQIEAYSLDLSDPLNPKYTLISSSQGSGWDSQYSLGCYSYIGDSPQRNSPISIFQFGSTTQSIFFPNGTWLNKIGSSIDASVDYTSPKLFTVVGSTNNWDWVLAKVSPKPGVTENIGAWRAMRLGSTLVSRPQNPMAMGSDLLLTAGTIAPNLDRSSGLLYSIDLSGSSGTVYKTTGNKRLDKNITTTESIVNITKAGTIDMGGNILTSSALPAVSAFAAVIVDKGPGGIITIYSIDPRSATFKLAQLSVNGQFPLFLDSQSITTLNSKIVVYGGIDKNGQISNALHIYDVISGAWTGPELVNPPTTSNTTDTGLSTPIIGGIAAGAVVIILAICFFIFRAKRRANEKSVIRQRKLDSIDKSNKDKMIQLLTLENNSLSALDKNGHQRSNDESGITLTESTHNILSRKSEDARKISYEQKQRQQSTKLHRPNRQSTTKSIKSVSGISLYSDASSVYLVDSPSTLPPTPMVPPAYITSSNEKFKPIQRHYATASTPGTPHSVGKKAVAYKVSVPDQYDDRQPLHRRNTDEYTLYQQSSVAAESTGSPESINLSWTGGAAGRYRSATENGHGQNVQTEKSKQNPLNSNANTNDGSSGGSSQTKYDTSQTPPMPPTGAVPSSHTTATTSHSPGSGKQRRTKKAPAYPRSKTDPSIYAAPTTVGSADYQYDSGSYKVEYGEPLTSPRQRQQTSSQSPRTPTTPVSGATAFSPTNSSYPPSPTTSTGASSLGPTSRDSRHFADVFPLPPKSKGSSSSRHRQQQQHSDWHQQQNMIYQEQQKLNQGFIPQSPKTPKLGSLPRPIPRDASQ
ncbi:hypothetical protein BGZ76_001608 [Entomortierella beljakovae]|nr:hypothetical protein BGZ76_001608 [Entomortierella beljakovae]